MTEYVLEKTPEQEQADLVAAAAPLIAAHYPAAIFNRDAAITAGYTFKVFFKHVQSVARFAENEQIRAISRLGVKADIFELHTECNIDQFVRLSKFLKSKEGQDALRGVSQQAKLQKRATGSFTAGDVAMESIFNIQYADYNQAMKTEQASFDHVLNLLRMEIKKVEKEWEERKVQIRSEFQPAASFVQPSENEIGNAAYELYVREAQNANRTPKPKNAGGLDYAIQHYGTQILKSRVVDFASAPENGDLLIAYLKQKVLQFRVEFNTKQESNLIHLVAATGRGQIEITPEEAEIGPMLYVPRGVTSTTMHHPRVQAPAGTSKRKGPRDAGTRGNKEKRRANSGVQTRSASRKEPENRENSDSSTNQPQQTKSDTHGEE